MSKLSESGQSQYTISAARLAPTSPIRIVPAIAGAPSFWETQTRTLSGPWNINSKSPIHSIDDFVPTNATTEEVAAWLEGSACRPAPR